MANKYTKAILKELSALNEKQNARAEEIEVLKERRNIAQAEERTARENQTGATIAGDEELFHRLRDIEREAADRVELCSRRIAMLNEPLLSEAEAEEVSEKLRAAVDSAIDDAEKAAADVLKKLRTIIKDADETVDAYNDALNFIGGNGGTGDTYNRMNSALFDIAMSLRQIQSRKPKSGVFVK